MKPKLAIIGASYLQNPLILKAKEMGIETHVFAWAAGDVGETTADYFYPISIVEKEQILAKCREIGIDGIATIASDLATIPVAYVASAMGLVGNSLDCVARSTNKKLMREAFAQHGDPSPRSMSVTDPHNVDMSDFKFPLIVKPADRSGSRGVTKLYSADGLLGAIARAQEESFDKTVLVEEFARGREFSVEFISWQKGHHFLAITEKFTTGAPHFIEMGHLEPARIDEKTASRVRSVVSHALDSLGVEYGASHSEIKIDEHGDIRIIEIGARMGGDFIGSNLVELSTGYDFVKAVIDVALGYKPDAPSAKDLTYAATRFVFDKSDVQALDMMQKEDPEILVQATDIEPFDHDVVDSSTRFGCYLFASASYDKVAKYLPTHDREGE